MALPIGWKKEHASANSLMLIQIKSVPETF
jgi:hypothetical protein